MNANVKTWSDLSQWPKSQNVRPEIMSRNEQAMLTDMRGDTAAGILPHYARDGFYDDGTGKHWISEEGQQYAKRRVADINARDRRLSALPRLPDRDELKSRIGD